MMAIMTGGDFLVECISKTTTLVPTFIPFAPLIGLSLWWLPVMDRQQNYANLCLLRQVVRSHGYQIEENVVGGLLGSHATDGVDFEVALPDVHDMVKPQ